MIHKSASACLDVNGDEQTNFNIGLRVNYRLRISKIEFTLEQYYVVGNPTTFDISDNCIYPLNTVSSSKYITPYAVMGVGFIKNDGDLKVVYNIVAGINLKFGSGRLITDFTTKAFFKYNQFLLGYCLNF